MDDHATAEQWKKVILARLYERRPRPVDLWVGDIDVTLSRDPPEEIEELFDATVYELRAGGWIEFSAQQAPSGQVFAARLTQSGLKRFEKEHGADSSPNQPIIKALERIRDILISVATGGPRIQQVDGEYRELYGELAAELESRGIKNPIPFTDLWQWHGRWSSGDLPSYQSRRQFIAELIDPVIATARSGNVVIRKPTGWSRVDRGLAEARLRLESAQNEEQFQAVGLICREVLISVADEVHDPQRHPTLDGIKPSSADFKRRLESWVAVELSGGVWKEVRQHARSALELTLQLQHKRTASFRDAAICVEATGSVVNIVAIISGRRDPA